MLHQANSLATGLTSVPDKHSLSVQLQPEMAFDRVEYRTRLDAVRAAMERAGINALVLTGVANSFWLSGFDGENAFGARCLIVPLEREPRLVVFEFERARAELYSWLSDVMTYPPGADGISAISVAAADMRLGTRIAVEQRTGGLPIPDIHRLLTVLGNEEAPDTYGLIEDCRLRKSPAEIAYMKRAAALTDAGAEAGFVAAVAGHRDSDVAAAINAELYGAGSELLSFGPVVATGYRSGLPHTNFNGRSLEQGDVVYMELTGTVRHYTAPMMRTGVIGKPTADMERLASVGQAAILAMGSTARPGVTCATVAQAALRELAPLLDEVTFHRFLGLPVGIAFQGLALEDLPFAIEPSNDKPLEAGMAFHLPISLRRYGRYGVNQSQTMLVTGSGSEFLSRIPLGLRQLD